MRKFVFTTFVFLLSVFSFTYTSAQQNNAFFEFQQKEYSEKQGAIDWLLQLKIKNMTESLAQKIVEAVYYNAAEMSVSPLLLLAVIKHESTFNPNAKSSYGAKGLMQVVARIHKDKLKGRNPYSAQVSIEVGSKIITDCLNKAKGNTNKALNCYSGGARYNKKIQTTHDSIKRHVLIHQFENNRVITADTYKFSKPSYSTPVTNEQTIVAYSFQPF